MGMIGRVMIESCVGVDVVDQMCESRSKEMIVVKRSSRADNVR
jgi:hypothetical protein